MKARCIQGEHPSATTCGKFSRKMSTRFFRGGPSPRSRRPAGSGQAECRLHRPRLGHWEADAGGVLPGVRPPGGSPPSPWRLWALAGPPSAAKRAPSTGSRYSADLPGGSTRLHTPHLVPRLGVFLEEPLALRFRRIAPPSDSPPAPRRRPMVSSQYCRAFLPAARRFPLVSPCGSSRLFCLCAAPARYSPSVALLAERSNVELSSGDFLKMSFVRARLARSHRLAVQSMSPAASQGDAAA